jgi:hypothetical protein
MDKTYPPEAWKRLGRALEARRGQLGYGFRQRGEFLADRGGPPPSVKMLARLERGERTTYPPVTVTRLESLYEMSPGSFEAILEGGEGRPLAPALRAAPDSRPGAAASPAEEILADLLASYPDDPVVASLATQKRKAARVIVNEILEWLEFLADRDGVPESNGTTGLPEGDP